MYALRLEAPGNLDVLTMPVGEVCRRLWRRLSTGGRRKGIAFMATGYRQGWAAPAMGAAENLLDIPTYIRMGRRLSCHE